MANILGTCCIVSYFHRLAHALPSWNALSQSIHPESLCVSLQLNLRSYIVLSNAFCDAISQLMCPFLYAHVAYVMWPPLKQLNYWFITFYLIVLVQLDCIHLEEREWCIEGSIWIMNQWTQETLKPRTFKANKCFPLFCMYIRVYLCVCVILNIKIYILKVIIYAML